MVKDGIIVSCVHLRNFGMSLAQQNRCARVVGDVLTQCLHYEIPAIPKCRLSGIFLKSSNCVNLEERLMFTNVFSEVRGPNTLEFSCFSVDSSTAYIFTDVVVVLFLGCAVAFGIHLL